MKNGNNGAWFNKDDWRDMRLVFDGGQPTEGFVRAPPLHDAPRQIYDGGLEKWVADPDSETLGQIDGCMAELAAIDRKHGQRATRYLALKAAREAGIGETDADLLRLAGAEERAEALRRRMAELKESIGI